ncbi:T9SS type A sorting domain-containing protein [Mangrovimonas sp. ST2L15]|uniref:T9SS type A sorting domain-containing protein n=1 Tax=Mangrovimonas sp. ST2L15 TaxID=1645916 RepID=UPI0006B645E5|nr:T9SS type A sorting domain-containing protein [Mangrovimonas sp. ST2L15]
MKQFNLLILMAIFLGQSIYAQVYNQTNTFGQAGLTFPFGRAYDSQNNYYTVGFHQGSFTYGDTTASFVGGNQDVFLTKTDANGNPVWVKSFNGAADNAGLNITIDNNDNIYLTGFFQGAGSNAFDADPDPNTEYFLAQTSFLLSRDAFIIKLDSNGDFLWAKQFSNAYGGANENGKGIKVDSEGNVYAIGEFLVADFDPGSSEYALCANNGAGIYTSQIDCVSTSESLSQDAYIVKLNASGDFIWAKQLKSLGTNQSTTTAESIDIDESDNLYIAGTFNQTIDLDPSSESEDLHDNVGSFDSYVVKLTNDGDFVWGHTFGNASLDDVQSVICINENVYVTGQVWGNTDFDPTEGENTISIQGGTAGFASKFNQDGTYLSTYIVDGNDASGTGEMIYSVGLNGGNLYFSGVIQGETDFDIATEGVVSETSNNNSEDAFLLVIEETTGNYVEHYLIGGTGDEEKIWADVLDQSIFLTGTFRSPTVDFNPFEGEDIQSKSAGQADSYVSVFQLNSLSIDEFDGSTVLTLYPSPAVDQIRISGNNPINKFEIYSITGQLVNKGDLTSNTIDISQLSKGTYLLKLVGRNQVFAKKIIKK